MEKSLLIPKVLLTICAMEFFGPIVRDSGHSHLINVEWVGHARVHLAWLLGFMGLSGVVNLWFIWRDSESKVRDLQLSALWQLHSDTEESLLPSLCSVTTYRGTTS